MLSSQNIDFAYDAYSRFDLDEMNDDECNAEFRVKSKGTYGQTRGLCNLEKKHVGELAIIGLFLKGVKTSWVYTPQGSSYVPKNRVCLSVAYYRLVSRIGRVAKLHGVVKSSWVTQDTPVQKKRLPVLPPSTQPRFNLMCICLLSKGFL